MYEMHAEPVFDDPALALRWHAVRTGDTLVAVCGYRPLPLDPALICRAFCQGCRAGHTLVGT
ncbi:hypothetical protein, partial [Kitasatospora sp. NPDC056531]|uniref:hypothetical protein n=1 Tax=Kitasatospora sp. NPDC056531 TaxID=3345856 RepID=UPI00369A5052